MRKVILVLLPIWLICFLWACNSPHNQDPPLSIDVSARIVIPKQYIAAKCQAEMNIDGIAEEDCWQNAVFSDYFIDIEGEKVPKYKTRMKMSWDEDYLYVYAELEEPHIWGDLKQRDTVIFYNNDFEVFIDPTRDTYHYGEIEINALGTVWDLLLDRPYRTGGKANNHWDLPLLRSAVHIEGTLNDPTDTDSMWTVEMGIPIGALNELAGHRNAAPEEGEQWSINFSRVEWDFDLVNGRYRRKKEEGEFLREYNWVWSNQKVINMHEPEKWGTLQFTNQRSLEAVELIVDEDLLVKQAVYALFRKTAFGELKELLEEEQGYVQQMELVYGEAAPLLASFYKTHVGFEYVVEIPDENEVFIISEKGLLMSQ